MQVTGYEDGSERPTRPKYDIVETSSGEISVNCGTCTPSMDPGTGDPSDPGTGDPGTGGGGGSTIPEPPTSNFVSSQTLGGYGTYTDNPSNAIQDLKIRKGSSSTINTSDLPGYYKIPVDLNKGAGGKYIYLCFTRDPEKVQGSSRWVEDSEMGRKIPVKNIHVEPQTVGTWPQFYDVKWTPIEAKDDLGFHMPDLNDGAGGKYIYSYQIKGNNTLPAVKEVGVLYGSSSSIQPPSGWKKIERDLNEGAGGDYIYFCVKY